MCRIERWSVLQLGERIQSMLFERTALSKKPEELIKNEHAVLRESGELTPDWRWEMASTNRRMRAQLGCTSDARRTINSGL